MDILGRSRLTINESYPLRAGRVLCEETAAGAGFCWPLAVRATGDKFHTPCLLMVHDADHLTKLWMCGMMGRSHLPINESYPLRAGGGLCEETVTGAKQIPTYIYIYIYIY